jgi:hypothetical protein
LQRGHDRLGPILISESGVVAGPFTLDSGDPRFTRLFFGATLRLLPVLPRISTVRSVSLDQGSSGSTVGLTRCAPSTGRPGSLPTQTLSFCQRLMDKLSDPAAVAVIVHELAHAWLNEHDSPEESRRREHDADSLARTWGFGPELDALDAEAETIER